MQRRLLGQGLQTSAIGLGCMGMTFAYAGADEQRSLATIDRALDLGIDLLDTADIYGPETNERLLAKVIRRRRADAVVATKFGARNLTDPERRPDGRPEYVREAAEASLRRLETDFIDLYYQHRVDPKVPIEETVGAMADLVVAGKVRHIGLSEASAETIRRAHAVHPITAVQTELSLWTRDVQVEVLPTLRELGIGLVAYSPLGRGFLTGGIRRVEDLDESDGRRRHPRFAAENLPRNLRLVESVEHVAAKKRSVTAAQVALAWVLAQGPDVVPIPGTTRPGRVEENAAAVELVLSRDELHVLDQAIPEGGVAGTRYPPEMMPFLET